MSRQFVLQGMQSTVMLSCHLAAVGLALILIFVLSRDERQLVSRSIGNSLLGLRLGILAVILLTLLQPTLSWTLEQKQAGRILVGIDLSESMSTTDQHASQGEKLRLARGLELIGTPALRERFDRWQQAFDSHREPEWVDPGETDDEDRKVALTESRKKQLASVFLEVEKMPRREMARRLIAATKEPLLGQLTPFGRVELFVFAGKSESVEADQLDKVVATPSASLITGTTDLSIPLKQGANGTGEVLGTILLTDGRDNSGQNVQSVAATLKLGNSPVYLVQLGSTFRPKDLSIALLEHPQAVYKGDHPQLKVTVSNVGFEGQTIEVELVSEDEPDAEPIRRSIKCEGNLTVIEFDLDAGEIGRKTFRVQVAVQKDETRDDNNSRSFSFNVVDDRAKVFLADGEARWEFRYINAAFSRDDRVDLKTVLFDQPHVGVLDEPFFQRRLILPADPEDLAGSPFGEIDLAIVGDVSPDQFTNAAWNLVLKFVSEGGTLVLSAGQRFMPLAHQSEALQQLLPVTKLVPFNLSDKSQEASPTRRGLPLRLTADGEQLPMLQFAPELAQNVALWKGLPGQSWIMLGEAKPTSTIWATTQVPPGRVEGLSTDRKLGIIVHQYVGSGQVVWVGTDATWRWRYRVGDKYHHRFWAQLARWAAANKMSAGTDYVRFGLEKAEVEKGQDARVRARWTHSFLLKFPNLKAQAAFYRRNDDGDRAFSRIDLVPQPGLPLQFEGRALALPSGEYQVRLESDAIGDKRIEAPLFVHDKPSIELSDLSTNHDLLAKIADASGGRLFMPDEVSELSKMFKKVEESTDQYQEMTLWDRWPWLVILFTLMMCEWVTRKLNGLP